MESQTWKTHENRCLTRTSQQQSGTVADENRSSAISSQYLLLKIVPPAFCCFASPALRIEAVNESDASVCVLDCPKQKKKPIEFLNALAVSVEYLKKTFRIWCFVIAVCRTMSYYQFICIFSKIHEQFIRVKRKLLTKKKQSMKCVIIR